MVQDARRRSPNKQLSDLERVERKILRYLSSQGRVWTLVGASPDWSQRFGNRLHGRLSGLLVDMALRGYFDLPSHDIEKLARLQLVQRENLHRVPEMRAHFELAFDRGMDVLLTTSGERRLDELERAARVSEEGRQGSPPVTVNISGSTVGALNVGTILGNLNAHVVFLEKAGECEVAKALQHIADAIGRTNALPEQRAGLLELVEALAEAAADPKRRRRTVAATLLASLQQGLANMANLATVWATWGPVLSHFFGLRA